MWIKTKAGKNMPVNLNLINYKDGGKEKIVKEDGSVVSGTITNPEDADGCGYISHFATCEHANTFRRK